MFGPGAATKIYVALRATDLRKGFDGFYGLVQGPPILVWGIDFRNGLPYDLSVMLAQYLHGVVVLGGSPFRATAS